MTKNKYSVHINPGDCCVVMPTAWARHIVDSYKHMMLTAESDDEYNAISQFVELMNEWIEETAVDYYE